MSTCQFLILALIGAAAGCSVGLVISVFAAIMIWKFTGWLDGDPE